MITSIVPAAGRSTRMGQPKLALPLGDSSVLQHVIRQLLDGGVNHVVVVIGKHVPELKSLASSTGADTIVLENSSPDMRTTVEYGFRWLQDTYEPRPTDACILAPGDRPAFDKHVVHQLCTAYCSQSTRSLVVPTYQGVRGHPSLIAWRHVLGIRSLPGDRGINAYFRSNAPDVLEVPVSNEGVLLNLDTPEDYAQLRKYWKGG